jgi:Putative beta-barrel porin-2, OmpL-like. bbp2
MRWKGFLHLGLGVGAAVMSTCTLAAQTPTASLPPVANPQVVAPVAVFARPTASPIQAPVVQKDDAPKSNGLGAPMTEPGNAAPAAPFTEMQGSPVDEPASPLGPTPFPKVGILQDWIFGKDNKCAPIWIGGWVDLDYTYSSNGPGVNNRAPVMNRFGDEFLARQIGLMVTKPLDQTTWSWGFNVIAIAGADAQFLQPTKGFGNQTNQRFGFSFTDLNVTGHMPILTDGGVDVKIGRQTTILGPMGALAWQRPLNSSDYAWYNMEEGRYTGISTVWHVSKQLDWYNGLEWGWGTFFAQKGPAPQYITNISYWLDCEAKDTKVWATLLTGPTTDGTYANTTVVEFGILKNWNRYLYTIVDTQMVYSKGPVFGGPPPPGYIERAYDVYTYNGVHLNKCWDVTTRLEYYYDADGQGYAGGFGIPKTSYYEGTVGLNYHPTKWVEFRPEIRYDGASNPAFGGDPANLRRQQLTISADILIKF